MTVGYLIKQKDFLGPQWTPDPGVTKEQCAGEDVPMEFADYCMLASKQNFWCDGLLLECLTKRLRTACVVFSWNKQEKLWQRSVIAHSFQGDVPTQFDNGIPVVTMMLINDHFWLLQPPTTDTPCPSAWLCKTPDRPRHLLKGAGKSTSLSLPSSSAKSVSKKTKSEPQKSKAQLRPSSELSLPASSAKTKKGKSLRIALSLPDSRSESSKGTGTRFRTCASSNQVKTRPPVQKSCAKKASSEAKVTKSSQEERDREVKHKYWKCPIPKCPFEVDCNLSMLQMTEKRRKHLLRKHGLSGAKLKAVTQSERMSKRLQAQSSVPSPVLVSRPELHFSFGLPMVPASSTPPAPGTVVWWRCTCGYEVMNGTQKDQQSHKWRHLRQEHGILRNNYAGQRESSAAFTPARIIASRQAFDYRWKVQWTEFQKQRWAGSHDLPLEATSWRQYILKAGATACKSFHKCRKCGIEVDRGSWWMYTCPKSKGEKIPNPETRKAKWVACAKKAKDALSDARVADGKRPTRRGYRGKKVREAASPGPENLRVWSQNIRSWHSNSSSLLQDANEAQVDILLLQETNATKNSTGSLLNKAQRFGWQMARVGPTAKHRGGVTVLAKSPLALVELSSVQSDSGQWLVVECHGLQESLILGSLYRHNSDDQFQLPADFVTFCKFEMAISGLWAWMAMTTCAMVPSLRKCAVSAVIAMRWRVARPAQVLLTPFVLPFPLLA